MTNKLRLDLPILLPNILHDADACVGRLLAELRGQTGVEDAHVRSDGSPATHQLCIHYDPDTLPLVRIRELVEAAGARITEQFGHLVWNIEGITHQRRARTVSEQLLNLPGVLEAEVSIGGVVRLEFDRQQTSEDDIRAALAEAGVDRKSETHRHEADGDHRHGGIFGANSELIFSLICGGLLVTGFAIEKLTPLPGWLPLACYLGAYFFGGFYTVGEAVQNLKLKRFEIDTLMLVAAAGAAALGAWAEGALLLFLFSLGHSLEHYAMGRAKRAIEALAE
ncbi:MAG TPA: heavy metal translocating P-type ATPase, partial [Candidatus Macondimonas sp.]|nr:heavy metal translocating P-type ATPase [Candidatus Macondimonas sp.]